MVRTDYLPRICRPNAVDNVFNSGRKVFEVGAAPTDVPTMPIEFSVAGFRLGHSMIRAAYNWNKIFDDGSGTLDFLFTFSATSGNLGGEARLPSNWIADFRRLYDFGEAGRANLTVPAAKFNRAKAIDTHLVDPLANLPARASAAPGSPAGDPRRNLAFRNLTRAHMVRLATGQQMATFMKSRGVNSRSSRRRRSATARTASALVGLTPKQRAALLRDTPLWFYILREAELNDGKLRGVGARIVAETFHRAIEGSQFSIVRDPRGGRRSAPTARPSGWSTCCCSPSRARRRCWPRSAETKYLTTRGSAAERTARCPANVNGGRVGASRCEPTNVTSITHTGFR